MRFDSAKSPLTYALIGAAIEVQRHLGTGLLEAAYGDALELELQDRGISFEREVGLQIHYKGRILRTKYRADFVVGDLILELKAHSGLGESDLAQTWHYLALTGKTTALLLNFGRSPLQVRRFVHGAIEPISADFVDFAANQEAGKTSELA